MVKKISISDESYDLLSKMEGTKDEIIKRLVAGGSIYATESSKEVANGSINGSKDATCGSINGSKDATCGSINGSKDATCGSINGSKAEEIKQLLSQTKAQNNTLNTRQSRLEGELGELSERLGRIVVQNKLIG